MKLKYEFMLTEVAGNKVAIAVGDDSAQFKDMIRLNKTGEFIFELMKDEISEEEIAAKLVENFEGVTPEQAKSDVETFIKSLEQFDILV